MTNSEKKQEIWAKIAPKFSHLENHCTISLVGIDDDSIYFHPTFEIEEGVSIRCQADGNRSSLYAPTFNSQGDNIFGLSINDQLIENVIVAWKQNKEIVLIAFDTLKKVNNHVETMKQYTNEYVNNLLIGNSIEQLSGDFINEIKTTTTIISLMQKTLKS